MTKATLEFYMKRGMVNLDDVDDQADMDRLEQAIKFSSEGKHEEALRALPEMFFEWIPSNGDGDVTEVFANGDDFKFYLDSNNSTIRAGVQDGNLVLTISVNFEMELNQEMEEDELAGWLDDNSMYFCGYVGNGWTYHSDDGCTLNVLSVE